MKALDFHNCCITSISARVDKSLRLGIVTPELTTEQRSAVMEYQGINARLLCQPVDVECDGLEEVTAERDAKTPAQRLRAVLFIYFKQQSDEKDFETFYRLHMEKLINHVKSKLDQP